MRHDFPTACWHNLFCMAHITEWITTWKCFFFFYIFCTVYTYSSVVISKCISHHIVTQFASPSAIVNPQGGAWPSCPRVVCTIILSNEYLHQLLINDKHRMVCLLLFLNTFSFLGLSLSYASVRSYCWGLPWQLVGKPYWGHTLWLLRWKEGERMIIGSVRPASSPSSMITIW